MLQCQTKVGIPYALELQLGKKTWPGFTKDSDEICPSCKQSPGSEGCCVVKKSYNIPGQDEPVLVDHTNEL